MDLTKRFPRSPRQRLAGIAMLPRTVDKARAHLAGTIGEYIFDCPMDKQLFATIGLDANGFLEIVRRSDSDDGVVSGLQARWSRPSDAQVDEHNRVIERWAPKSEQGKKHFEEQRRLLAPARNDITTWTDLIDIEEGRLAAT